MKTLKVGDKVKCGANKGYDIPARKGIIVQMDENGVRIRPH